MLQALLLTLIAVFAVVAIALDLPDSAQLPRQPELPDPLLTVDGKRVASKEVWVAKRRPELKTLFEHYMYGRYPELQTRVAGKVLHEDSQAFSGKATLREVQVDLGVEKSPPIYLLIAIPNKRSGPVPAFIGMNFCGNHCLTSDAKVRIPTAWMYDRYPGVKNNRATEEGRGKQTDVWPLEQIVDRGYAVATFYSGDIEPDRNDVREGIAATVGTPSPEHTGRIMAWAWGIHRALDYLTTLDAIDAKRIAVVGHSRLGKTALLAAAFDERIALAIPHQAGCGGTAPSRCNTPKGETVKRINTSFPHWFCGRFKEFNDDPAKLPFDQHCLVALCAPRPVLFTNAVEDQWADPPGQFDVLKAASPAYEFLGVEGMKAEKPPPPGQLVDSRLGYFIRPGQHSMTLEDWKVFLQFADKWLTGPNPKHENRNPKP
jgi:dienelactone hydrolase